MGLLPRDTRTHFEPRATRVQVPMGCALFAKEPFQAPRAWVAAVANVCHWREFPSGGHFAVWPAPACPTCLSGRR